MRYAKTRLFSIFLLTGFLLAGCTGGAASASQDVVSGSRASSSVSSFSQGTDSMPDSVPVPVSSSAAASEPDAAASDALRAQLDNIRDSVQPGTAGSTLRAAQVAADLLTWGTESTLTAQQVDTLTRQWLAEQEESVLADLPEQLASVDATCQMLQRGEGTDLLESAGWEDTANLPWGSEPEPLVEALLAAAGLPE